MNEIRSEEPGEHETRLEPEDIEKRGAQKFSPAVIAAVKQRAERERRKANRKKRHGKA